MLARLQGQALYGFSFAGNRVVPKTKCCTQQLHAWYMCVCVYRCYREKESYSYSRYYYDLLCIIYAYIEVVSGENVQ